MLSIQDLEIILALAKKADTPVALAKEVAVAMMRTEAFLKEQQEKQEKKAPKAEKTEKKPAKKKAAKKK